MEQKIPDLDVVTSGAAGETQEDPG
jgi:hypothetical protein